jgi:hypothetical protein
LISIYNSYYNQIQLLQQLFTIGLTINYNSIVKESSVLCTMACQQRPMDCASYRWLLQVKKKEKDVM